MNYSETMHNWACEYTESVASCWRLHSVSQENFPPAVELWTRGWMYLLTNQYHFCFGFRIANGPFSTANNLDTTLAKWLGNEGPSNRLLNLYVYCALAPCIIKTT